MNRTKIVLHVHPLDPAEVCCTPAHDLVFAVNHYITTADLIGEGMVIVHGEHLTLQIPQNPKHPTDCADWKRFQSRVAEIVQERRDMMILLLPKGKTPRGEMDLHHLTVHEADIPAFCRLLMQDGGAAGFGWCRGAMDRECSQESLLEARTRGVSYYRVEAEKALAKRVMRVRCLMPSLLCFDVRGIWLGGRSITLGTSGNRFPVLIVQTTEALTSPLDGLQVPAGESFCGDAKGLYWNAETRELLYKPNPADPLLQHVWGGWFRNHSDWPPRCNAVGTISSEIPPIHTPGDVVSVDLSEMIRKGLF